MRTHTLEDVEYDLSLVSLLEETGSTQSALARQIGMSEGHLSRRLARARRHRAERENAGRRRQEQADEGLDRFDHPYMALDAPGIAQSGYAACTAEGRANRDQGTYNVGGQVQSLGFGRKAKDEDLTDDLTNATSYQPDPNLKGGVG